MRPNFPKSGKTATRGGQFKFYLVGSLLVVIAMFLSLEAATRILSWSTGRGVKIALHELGPLDSAVRDLYRWHPFTGITFKPNMRFPGSHPNQKDVALITTDEHGFLSDGQPLAYEKSEGEIRIATIGGSTTAGINLSHEQNWPGRLGRLLQEALPDKKVRVINAGVPGFDTAQSIGNLALKVLPFKPDIVIVYHAYNDLKAVRPDGSFKPDYSHIHKVPYGCRDKPGIFTRALHHSMFYVRVRNKYRDFRQRRQAIEKSQRLIRQEGRLDAIPQNAILAFEDHIRSLVSLARAGGAKVVLSSFATLHDPALSYDANTALAAMDELKNRELFLIAHFTPGLTVNAAFEGIQRYNGILQKVAREEQTAWVDNAALVPHSESFFVDRVHFRAEGARQMAANFFPIVLKQLES
jgi:lysophospholipase L1-like esterase